MNKNKITRLFKSKPHFSVNKNTLVFYVTLLGVFLALLILICCATVPVKSYLEQYELSQPKYVSDEVFELLYSDPDWALIYDLAGVKSTKFEGKTAFCTYMETLVGAEKLTYRATSSGLSGERKYLVRCGDIDIGAFILESNGEEFPTWTLSGVETYYTPNVSITIDKQLNETVYINGVALDDSYTVSYTETVAEAFLPDDVHGFRQERQIISGLLVEPEIVVLNADNQPVSLTYDETTGIYTTAFPSTDTIAVNESAAAVRIATAQARYAIHQLKSKYLKEYFLSETEIYDRIYNSDAFLESVRSYTVNEDSIILTDFRRYNDDIFSVHITLTIDITITRTESTTYTVDTTYFIQRQLDGGYLAFAGTDKNALDFVTTVTATYSEASK